MQTSKKVIIILSALIIILIAAFVVFTIVGKKKTTTPVVQENITAIIPENGTSTDDTDYSQIAKDIEKKKTANQANAEDLIRLGVSYYNLNKLDQAADAYKSAIAKDPNNALAYGNLGNVLRDQGKYEEAKAQYQKSISISPEYISAYISLAVMLRALEDNKPAALEALNQGLVSNPGNGILQNLLTEYSK